jgi:hypothetical protein
MEENKSAILTDTDIETVSGGQSGDSTESENNVPEKEPPGGKPLKRYNFD